MVRLFFYLARLFLFGATFFIWRDFFLFGVTFFIWRDFFYLRDFFLFGATFFAVAHLKTAFLLRAQTPVCCSNLSNMAEEIEVEVENELEKASI